jgi:cathepsin L
MKSILVAVAVLAASVVALPPRWHQLRETYSYDEYLRDFGKSAPAGERSVREGLFRSRLAAVMQHNRGSSSWKKGINHMSDWTLEERKRLLGRVHQGELLGGLPAPVADAAAVQALPASVDWRDKGVVTPVKDQGQCGSCWAFTTTEVTESHVAINTGVLMELAPQELVACMENPNQCGGGGGCAGAVAQLGFDYIKEHGIASPYSFPYESWAGTTNGTCYAAPRSKAMANVTGYVQLPNNDAGSLLQAVATAGPVAVSVAASEWSDYESGVFDGCSTSGAGTDIDHAVMLVGYDSESWIIRNSWTPLWGESGYIRLKRFPNGEPCGTDTSPGDGFGCTGGPSTIKVCGMCGVLSDSAYPVGAQIA